jgi:chemotaxis protein CheX
MAGNAASTAYVLPSILDIEAATPLANELLARRGNPLTLDASGVQRLGGLCLQVLLSARKTWAADGVPMDTANGSPAFMDALVLFGVEALAEKTEG